MSSAPSRSLGEALAAYPVVILTGGSSGIGRTFIERVHRLSPDAWICNLSRRDPPIITPELKLRHIPCDLADRAALRAAIDDVLRWLKTEAPAGRILLINNSGFGGYGTATEQAVDHQLEMIDVNVRALVELTVSLLPVLHQRGGAVVNIASTAAFQPTAYMAAYGAAKAFVLHWGLALREELRGSGVHVLTVCPGPTSTEFFRRAGLKQGTVPDVAGQTSEEVVDEALAALARRRGLVVTGWKNKCIVAVSAALPKRWSARLSAWILLRIRAGKAGP